MDWSAISVILEWDWTKISTMSSSFMVLVVSIAAIVSVLQFIKLSKSSTATAYVSIFQFLQREHIREARHILITELEKKNFKHWFKEEKEKAAPACASYDVVGAMVRKRLINKFFVVDKWRNSIIRCWEVAEPMVKEYRRDRGDDFWDDFERIYKMAKKRRRKS